MMRRVSVWGALALAAAAIGSIAVRAQNAVFSARTEAVRVDVLVQDRDRGEPLRGLTAGDFEVLDNGVAQHVDLVSFEQIPLNLVLALDMSDSVAGDRLEHLRTAGGSLLGALHREDQAALVEFSHVVSLAAPLSGDFATVRTAIDGASGFGGTALVDGAYAGITIGESDVGRALLIVFSDGVDTASFLQSDAVLDIARRSDVVAYGVSVRSRVRPEFLKELTSLTGGRLLEIERTANLAATFLAILEEFRHRYLISYTPEGVVKTGWHKLDVRVKRPNVAVRARPGYLGGT